MSRQQSAVKSPGISSVQSDDDDDEDDDPSYTSSESRKRPRREAAVAAARLIPRQPSPFELSPPPSRGSSAGGAQSNRKVSHSLIERRRRERINDCLSHLKQIVPQCRAEGEKKVAKAKERGRKRGRKGGDIMADEAQRGGLHKLEILQVSGVKARPSDEIVLANVHTAGHYSLCRGARGKSITS